MIKFSSTAVLLVLSLLMAGSSRSGPVTRQDIAAVPAHSERGRLIIPAHSAPPLAMVLISRPSAASAMDLWLTFILGGGLIARQLRRTQKGARLARLSV